MRIANEIMHRTGLSRYGEEDEAVRRWVAVHHGDNHIHIVATLARQNRRRARLDNDYYRIREALQAMEVEYGLRRVARGGQGKGGRGHPEKADPGRAGILRCLGTARAAGPAAARNANPGEVTGYAVGLPGDLTADGDQIYYSGGKLAPDLTLPKLRRRWP